MRGLEGLRLGSINLGAINPAVQAQRADPPAGGGTKFDEGYGHTNIAGSNPASWSQVENGARVLAKQVGERNTMELKTLTPILDSTCPATSIVSTGKYAGSCYNGGPSQVAELVPGTFVMWGVPFNIAEVGVNKSPRFDRHYFPSTEQRFWAEYLIAKRTRERLSDTLEDAFGRHMNVPFGNAFSLVKKKVSLQGVLQIVPELKLVIPNFSMRGPIPTNDEMVGEGGYKKYVDRGGWFISTKVATGAVPIMDESVCPAPCMSISCRCPSSTSGLPACVEGGVPTSQADNLGGCFHPYISIDQVAPFSFHMALVHDDPSWIQKVGGKLEAMMTSFANVLCTAAPALQTQLSTMVQQKCVDKKGKPCIKGPFIDCTCVSPSAATQGAVGMMNFFMGMWCKGWVSEQTPLNPQNVMPPFPDPPPMPISSGIPWWAVAIGGLAVGAFVFSRQ